MSKIVFLLLCFLGADLAVGVGPENSPEAEKHTEESPSADLDPAESIAEIEPNEVLPLIIFVNPETNQFHYQMPEKLLKVELNEGKICNGTKFESRQPGEQTFLCPRNQENSEQKCLARKTFEGSEPLRCGLEQLPKWVNKKDKCGGGNRGTIFESAYKICDSDEHPFDPEVVSMYQICYETGPRRTMYTSHEIMSPRLLNLNVLMRERGMEYPVVTGNGPIFSGHQILNDAITEETTSSEMPNYELQQMVPAEDMAFATWRKATFNNLNYEWQHEKLIGLWNEISKNIRSVDKTYIVPGGQFMVNTAIVDVPNTISLLGDENQLSNIWVKMVYVSKSLGTKKRYTRGMAILMSNSINIRKSSDLRNMPLKTYCNENFCIDELNKKFDQIGGAIRCCPITPQISKIFELKMKGSIEEIRIPNVTATEDQDISLRKIQPNEMLPLILSFNRIDQSTISLLSLPTSIEKIETKNQRIVQGSVFANKWSKDNLFFCPKDDSNETCLIPKKFGRFEPLQCAKEAIPIVQEVTGNGAKCGFEDGGIMHKVFYEFCPVRELNYFRFNDMPFYKICYNKNIKRNLYTRHQILSPGLIFSNFLLREQTMNHFPMMADDSIPVSSEIEQSVPGYKLQKLVPSEDMAFAIWKKTTYQRINSDWQHEALIPLWNKINDRIRKYCFSVDLDLRQYQNPYQEFMDKTYNHADNSVENYVYTGVFDIEYESHPQDPKDDQKSNIWVKVIHTKRATSNEVGVILMNNFIISKEHASMSPNSKENIIRRYCYKSSCLEDIENEFEDIGGRVRCCSMTAKIEQLFGNELVFHVDRVLLIDGLTK